MRRPDGVEQTARAGLFGKGALYLVLGLLAAQVALRGGGEEASQSGAVEAVAAQPFGSLLVGALAVGLSAYALWRLVQSVVGVAGSSSLPGPLLRATFVVRGIGYGAVAFLAWRTLVDGRGASGGDEEQELTARVLSWPFGVPLVVAVGAVIVLVGLYQAKVAVRRDFLETVDLGAFGSTDRRRWFERAGVAGHAARAVAYVLVGGLLVRAALRFDPDDGVGLGAALAELASAPFGTAMLLVVALGLVLYGGYCVVLARVARVEEVT